MRIEIEEEESRMTVLSKRYPGSIASSILVQLLLGFCISLYSAAQTPVSSNPASSNRNDSQENSAAEQAALRGFAAIHPIDVHVHVFKTDPSFQQMLEQLDLVPRRGNEHRAAAFLGVQLALTGLYLGVSFAASHIGMPILPHDSRIDFFRRQVLTSRNIRGGRIASFAMGGLNYQIEHHLFPNMARPNLGRARTVVQQFCAGRDVTYHEVTIVRAWRIVVGYLNRVGLAARAFQCPVTAALR